MISSYSRRRDLVDRLRYTFATASYSEIDDLIKGLRQKENYEALCEEFFHGCSIDSRGNLVPDGFFANNTDTAKSTSLLYAMYELLGSAPDTFLLKHRVLRVKLLRGNFRCHFILPKGLFALPQLKVLIVRDMGITQLPNTISQTHSLRILDLAGNRLTHFPETILKLTRLSALNLSFNSIQSLPDTLNQLKFLRILSLRGNKITVLPEDWHQMQFLRTLDLSMNRITAIPDAFRTLITLQHLNLSYNNLEASTEALWEKKIQNGELRDEIQGSLEFDT